MSEKFQRFSVSLPKQLLEEFDSVIDLLGMTRSDAIRKAMRDFITRNKWLLTPKEGIVVGSITLILDHEQKYGIMDDLNELQHHHREIINASLHIHLDQQNCMMVLPVRGNAQEIKKLNIDLQAMPEVKETKLTLISAGKKFE
ncbi:MAG: nickel-responsive transcriptional regulator NikR [Candidatus Helarchaeota archaeon]|nr:nickel-responsive transcriptional regulator NikR [Candidatus Helarchaeota archaeon]